MTRLDGLCIASIVRRNEMRIMTRIVDGLVKVRASNASFNFDPIRRRRKA